MAGLQKTKIKKILSTRHTKFRENDSLYIHIEDIELFVENYSKILNGVKYNNQETEVFEIYGFDYYNENQVKEIINKIIEKKPKDYDTILKWLQNGQTYNGFYFIGI